MALCSSDATTSVRRGTSHQRAGVCPVRGYVPGGVSLAAAIAEADQIREHFAARKSVLPNGSVASRITNPMSALTIHVWPETAARCFGRGALIACDRPDVLPRAEADDPRPLLIFPAPYASSAAEVVSAMQEAASRGLSGRESIVVVFIPTPCAQSSRRDRP